MAAENIPKVFIIILNYNGYRDTIECIDSIKKSTYKNYEIIIIDNNSTDNSERILLSKYPEYHFIQTGINNGFAWGNNFGIKYSIDNGADYVLLLNNDTIVTPNFLQPLISLAESDKRIGIVGGKIYYYNEPKKIWYAGASINTYNGKTKHLGDKDIDNGQFDNISETGYVTGCMMFVNREAIKKAGLMDENYFLYYEETDWNVRIKKCGYRIVFTPYSIIYHKVSSSMQDIKQKKDYLTRYYYDRNSYYFIIKNYGIPNKIYMFLYIRSKLILRAFKSVIQHDKEKLKMTRYTYRSIITRKMGRFI